MSESFPHFSPDSHGFNVGIATTTKNVNAAIVFNHIFFWLKQNKIKNIHQIDERTWMYESIPDIAVHFPYLSEKQVKNALTDLVTHGYLLKSHHHQNKMDRVNWYAVCNEDWLGIKKVFTKSPIGTMHQYPQGRCMDTQRADVYKDTDIKPDIETDIYTDSRKSEKKVQTLPFGTYVVLKEGEYEALCKQLGEETVGYYIKAIDNWVPNHKPYKDYAAAIRQWHLSDKKKGETPNFNPTSSTSPPSQSETMETNKKWFKQHVCKQVHHIHFYECYDYVEVRDEREDSEKIYFKDTRFKEKLKHELTKRKLL